MKQIAVKTFNTTGTCIPGKHFTADVSAKVQAISQMVSKGHYFTINRPRQFGKTTIMYLLYQHLQNNSDYLVLDISFEGIDAPTYSSYERFIQTLLNMLKRRLTAKNELELSSLIPNGKRINGFDDLSHFLSDFIRSAGRKTVLMIDEVDKSSNNQLFLDFLGMLRQKYLARNEGKDVSFHSVILAGVHDVKTLKTKIRPGDDTTFNSPWNIAVDFNVDLSLFSNEITPMLREYAAQEHVEMDPAAIADKLVYFTSGYPFLVSFLCQIIDEEILPHKTKKEWTIKDLEKAIQIGLKKDNTNSRSLIKNLENSPELYDLVFDIVMNEKEFSFNRDNPLIDFGAVYGILKEENGKTRIHNRFYEQRIFNYMASKLETSRQADFYNIAENYLDEDGFLDVKRVIRKFQAFMAQQYSEKDQTFIERNGRLLFLTFIKPIINGRGFDFKEVQVSEEKRLDIVITFLERRYIIELKIWRGEAYHQKGLNQLAQYLENQNEPRGYLLIFDLRKKSGQTGQSRTIEHAGKEIFTAWV